MKKDLEAEVTRVTALASQAQHAASAAAIMGGSTKPHTQRRDALIAKLRAACVAIADGSDDERAKCLADLRAET